MSRSRRPQVNTIDAGALARWIVLGAFLMVTGLVYVYQNVRLYGMGNEKKALENELVSLRAQNEVASGQVAALTSRSALQRRLKEGYLKMVPIPEEKIVRLSAPLNGPGEDEIQPVANQHSGR